MKRDVKLLIMDTNATLADGKIYISENGEVRRDWRERVIGGEYQR